MFRAIISTFHLIVWLLRQKKLMEKDVAGYLSEERAKAWRLYAERVFYALSTGNGNIKKLPRVVQWLFASTQADNRAGEFGLHLLKSSKLAGKDDEALKQPLYRCQ